MPSKFGIPDRTYQTITEVCLGLGVVSAVAFDTGGHNGWLAIGGVAAIIAIATYFARHWKTPRRQR